ncbi:contractile injection system tape measure protein [Ideonella sp. DXS22W]|uniref:Contractile injection system tape measure protein n=1 Tax=Pseudaquabacterium inlustre TaxID=2984192 RepID=A0ABU9CA24_9BURK
MARHRILRQVIELQGCPPGTDAALRAQLGELARRHLLPVIERAFEALDQPGRLLRAQRLDLQLPAVPLGTAMPGQPVDEAWARAFAAQLDGQLGAALTQTLQLTDPHQADLELLDQFIARGHVPWWAPLDQADLVPATLRRVLADARAPAALRALGLVGAGADAAWQRLAATAGEAARAAWLAALWPDAAAAGGPAQTGWPGWPWREALADAVHPQGRGRGQVLRAWWQGVLPLAAQLRATGVRGPDPAMLPALAARLAAALGVAPAPLWPVWRQAFDRRLSAPQAGAGVGDAGPAQAWWRALAQPDGHDATAERAAHDWLRRWGRMVDGPGAHRHAAARLDTAPEPLAHLCQVLVRHWARWPVPAREAAVAALADAPAAPARGDPAWQALAGLAQAALRDGLLPARWRDDLRQALLRQPSDGALAPLHAALHAALRHLEGHREGHRPRGADAEPGASDAPTIDRGFAASDGVAVVNAGLVLLWPFLPAFFGRLGWLLTDGPQAGRAFAQPALAACAARLLHALAQGPGSGPAEADADDPDADPPVPEHWLPLAKLLCGLAPESPLPASAAPDAAARAEGDLLLQAVIAQAPILREMSVPAFRGSFLWRDGQLGVRDGHWLLRVERAAYDMVRDRFPWGVSLVRLPWMDTALQVEW